MCRAGQHRPRPPLVTHHNTPTQTKIMGGAAPRGHLFGSSASPPPVQELSGSKSAQPSTGHSADTGAPMRESSKGSSRMMVVQKNSPQLVCVHTCDKSRLNAKCRASGHRFNSKSDLAAHMGSWSRRMHKKCNPERQEFSHLACTLIPISLVIPPLYSRVSALAAFLNTHMADRDR